MRYPFGYFAKSLQRGIEGTDQNEDDDHIVSLTSALPAVTLGPQLRFLSLSINTFAL